MFISQLLMCEFRMPLLTALDSTISARTPVSRPIGTERALCCDWVACFSNLLVNQKVEPAPGEDSTWWFTSRFEKQATQSQHSARSVPIGLLTGVRALIVESSAVNSGILNSHMNNWEMNIRVAATPKQASVLLAEAAARGVPYDIALIDLAKPGLDALEFARGLRRRAEFASLRLVMLTRRHADIRSAREAGFDACLVKPVRQTVLYESLVNAMAGR